MEEALVEVCEHRVRTQLQMLSHGATSLSKPNLTGGLQDPNLIAKNFLVNRPSGLILPLSFATFKVILKPQSHLPRSPPTASS
ncbi:hypothetical protein ACSQ67_024523 [Phaseolus vulgaris]